MITYTRTLSPFTVCGLVDEEGNLKVAGVIAGDHPCLDADDTGVRYSVVVQATGPEDAEGLAESAAYMWKKYDYREERR